MSIKDTIKATDLVINAVKQPKPAYWCQTCEIALHEHECDFESVSDSYEFWGELGMNNTVYVTCGACGSDVEDYDFQDIPEEEE